MAGRRILSLWFPRLAADRVMRLRADAVPMPLAVVADRNGAQVLVSLSAEAEVAGPDSLLVRSPAVATPVAPWPINSCRLNVDRFGTDASSPSELSPT